jgi:ribose/xylose/arabinose/galactoside ABC-type transport system permease subunit
MLLRTLDHIAPPSGRPLATFIVLLLVLVVLDRGNGYLLQRGTVFSVAQSFATLGPVALGLGLAMIIGEYDISLPGTFALAGIVAVLAGQHSALLGLAAAVGAGLGIGLIQGLIMTWLRVSAIAVTLGGLLVLLGLTYMLAGGGTVSLQNSAATNWVSETLAGGLISNRAAVVIGLFACAAVVIGMTRIGRDILATGSNAAGAALAGVDTRRIRIGVMAAAGGLSALGGALLSYSLASAASTSLSDVLVPATAAVIIGGVSLGGGKGRPAGIAAGVLCIALLRSGLSAIGVNPFMLETITGLVLAAVAIADAPLLADNIAIWRRRLR